MRLAHLTAVFTVVGFIALMPLNGQLDQGQISGTIQDASNASVAGASVTAVGAQGASVSAKTGDNGS
ncbi:MAG: carboxypeptidase-like regulatory domain-containing protein, partial [Bryobacteraceae bacterium]